MNTPLSPPTHFRPQTQAFYAALLANNVNVLEDMFQAGYPLDWAQAFAQISLPEWAMKHGAVEAAWWLMSKNIMPESWSAFGGSAWTSFLRRGLSMALGQGPGNLSIAAYKNIALTALKTTGEKLPSSLEAYITREQNPQVWQERWKKMGGLMNGATSLMEQAMRSLLTPDDEEASQERPVSDPTPTQETPPPKPKPAKSKPSTKKTSKTSTKSKPRSKP